ncbi:hypothetical protein HK101_008445 [Irineochytrium annulatum]|nr:hypothetical protein HK101_008445 [Irineochytrium annulatum]
MLRFIDKLVVSYAPLSRSSRSARSVPLAFFHASLLIPVNFNCRTLLSLASAEPHLRENPKAKIIINQSDKVESPSVEATYSDNHVLRLATKTMYAAEIVKELNKHSKKLKLQADFANM